MHWQKYNPFKFDGPFAAIIFGDLLLALTFFIFLSQFPKLSHITDLTSHFLIQYMVGCVVTGVVLACYRQWRKVIWCAVLLGVCGVNFILSPRPAAISHERAENSTRIIQYNKLKTNENYERIRDALRAADADIVVLQEATFSAERLGLQLGKIYPHQIIATEDHAFGMMVLSKFPLEHKSHLVHGNEFPNTILEIIFRPPGFEEDVQLFALHAVPPMQRKYWIQRNLELKEAAKLVQSSAHKNIVLMGDWNISPYSVFFGDVIEQTGLAYTSEWPVARPTWPADLDFSRGLLQIPIDHVLFSPTLSPEHMETASAMGSDHRMVIINLGERL